MAQVAIRKPLKLRTDEYDRMADLGVFDHDRHGIELIGGQLYEMAPIGTAHLILVTRLSQQLANINAQGRLLVQQPILVSDFDELQPDLAVLKQPLSMRKPYARDCDIIIEVSDTTYKFDRGIKTARYLEGGASWVLIVNVAARQVESFGELAKPDPQTGGMSRIGDVQFDVDALFQGFAQGSSNEP